jgi:hypothetical protein
MIAVTLGGSHGVTTAVRTGRGWRAVERGSRIWSPTAEIAIGVVTSAAGRDEQVDLRMPVAAPKKECATVGAEVLV